MRRAIGFIELNSIAKGVETADIVLKTAAVHLLFSKASCPGKYYILFTGDVAAVQASVDSGLVIAGPHAVDSCVIPNIDERVIEAVNMAHIPDEMAAVGVMEFYSVTAAVYGADAAVKAANVRLGTGIGGKSFVVLTGEVAAVRASIDCGVNTSSAEGMVVSSVVIPSPHPELLEYLM